MADLADATERGDHRAALKLLAVQLANDLEATHPKDVAHAPLAEQYRKTIAALEGLGESEEVDEVDELAPRRTAKAKVSTRPTRGGKRRAAGD